VAQPPKAGASPTDVQAIAGHAKLSTTLDVYTHAFAGSAERARAKIDASLGAIEQGS
jgi:hypothetical protein